MTDEQILKAMAEMLKPIRDDLEEVKQRVGSIEGAQEEIKQRVTKIEVVQENVIHRNIQLLFEGQKDTLHKFSQLDALVDKVDDIQTTVEVLKVLTVKK